MKSIFALILALALLTSAALAEGRELSGYFGKDIKSAAEEIGGLTYAEGTEFKDNYTGDALALRGDGTVRVIELKDAPGGDSLCGVSVGMARKDQIDGVRNLREIFRVVGKQDRIITLRNSPKPLIIRLCNERPFRTDPLLLFFSKTVNIRVTPRLGAPCVGQLHHQVDQLQRILHRPFCLGHMAWIPLNLHIVQASPHRQPAPFLLFPDD